MEDQDLILLDFPASSSTPESEATITIPAVVLEIPAIIPEIPSTVFIESESETVIPMVVIPDKFGPIAAKLPSSSLLQCLFLTLCRSKNPKPTLGTELIPSCPDVNDLDLPIAIRKGTRKCTQYPTSHFIS